MRPRTFRKSNDYSVRAVLRVLDILDVLQGSPNGLSLAEITEVARIPRSSAFRYVTTLESRGYVERDPSSGHFRLGAAFLPLRSRHVEVLAALARPYLEELRDRFEETINLGLLERNRIAYLEIVESPRTMRFAARRGDRDPIHSTGLGKAVAAQLPEEEVRRILAAEGMPQRTRRTITDPEQFLKELETVRRRGFALDRGENEEDGRCVAVAISSDRRPAAAISVSAPATRVSADRVEEIAAALIRTAERLAVELERAMSSAPVGALAPLSAIARG